MVACNARGGEDGISFLGRRPYGKTVNLRYALIFQERLEDRET
jgi:hypothetical protein